MTLLAQIKRELTAYFYSPIAYVLLCAAMIVNGFMFIAIVDLLSDPRSGHGAPMQMLFGGTIFFWILVLMISPLITMRLLAEERHSGTLETLLTAPISDTVVVISKYLASVIFWVLLWLPTLSYALFLSRFSSLDPGPILSGYMGTLGVGMMFLSMGLFWSALTRNQIVAALLGFAGNMTLFFLGVFDFLSPSQDSDSVLGYLNLWNHMDDFGRGIVDTRHLVYYGSVTLFMLFATVQALQARRWRG
jgi:gliding motility-associated transport system permease protein